MSHLRQGLIMFLLSVFFVGVHLQGTNNYFKSQMTGDEMQFLYGKGLVKYGIASYYADKFEGRETANGETHQQDVYSAACNVIPFNTWIRVTNLKNKKSVVVKINDRLHPKNKRLVDLSMSAARELGYINSGITRVKVEVITPLEEVETDSQNSF